MTLSQEKIFYNYLRENPIYFRYVKSYFFKDNEIKQLFRLDNKFMNRYNEVATKEQLIQLIEKEQIEEFYSDINGELFLDNDLLDRIFETDITQYDKMWLSENFEYWIEFKTLENSVVDVVKLLKVSQVTADNIKDMVNTVKKIIVEQNNVSFTEELGSDIIDIDTYFMETKDAFTTGYKWIDKCLGGGLTYKTLSVFFAPPKTGKCSLGSTKIEVRNKKTNEVKKITMEEFNNLTKNK